MKTVVLKTFHTYRNIFSGFKISEPSYHHFNAGRLSFWVLTISFFWTWIWELKAFTIVILVVTLCQFLIAYFSLTIKDTILVSNISSSTSSSGSESGFFLVFLIEKNSRISSQVALSFTVRANRRKKLFYSFYSSCGIPKRLEYKVLRVGAFLTHLSRIKGTLLDLLIICLIHPSLIDSV